MSPSRTQGQKQKKNRTLSLLGQRRIQPLDAQRPSRSLGALRRRQRRRELARRNPSPAFASARQLWEAQLIGKRTDFSVFSERLRAKPARATLPVIRRAFEDGGIEFLGNDGVRFKG
jgi:hypothetical protein